MTCEVCGQTLFEGVGCLASKIEFEGQVYDRTPFGKRTGDEIAPDICHDCGCKKGQFHHAGCDMDGDPVRDIQLLFQDHRLIIES